MADFNLDQELMKGPKYQAALVQLNGAAHMPGDLPQIRITANLTEMVDAAESALMALPGPVLYQRAKMICRIAPAGESPKWLQRPPDAPTVTVHGVKPYRIQIFAKLKYIKSATSWPVLTTVNSEKRTNSNS